MGLAGVGEVVGSADADVELSVSKHPEHVVGSHNQSRWIQDPSAERCHWIASLPAMTWEFVPVLLIVD